MKTAEEILIKHCPAFSLYSGNLELQGFTGAIEEAMKEYAEDQYGGKLRDEQIQNTHLKGKVDRMLFHLDSLMSEQEDLRIQLQYAEQHSSELSEQVEAAIISKEETYLMYVDMKENYDLQVKKNIQDLEAASIMMEDFYQSQQSLKAARAYIQQLEGKLGINSVGEYMKLQEERAKTFGGI